MLYNRILVIYFFPFILGILTTLSFAPFNLTIVNFLTFPILLFLVLLIKKRTESKYRKKNLLDISFI